MKLIVRNYVINAYTENIKDLLDFLEKYNIKAYNYKIIYNNNNKVSFKAIISKNVLLSIENMELDEAEKVFTNKLILGESKYLVEFHNVIHPEVIERLNSLSFPLSESRFDVFKNYVLGSASGFRFYDKLDLKGIKCLSKKFEEIVKYFRPFNIGWLRECENAICFVALKYFGVRNLDFISKVKECEIGKDHVKFNDILVYKDKVIKNGKVIKIEQLYKE